MTKVFFLFIIQINKNLIISPPRFILYYPMTYARNQNMTTTTRHIMQI